MNNPENLENSSENLSNEQNKWEEMAAEAPEFDQEAAKEAVRKEYLEKIKQHDGKTTMEKFDILRDFINTGDIKGHEKEVDDLITLYKESANWDFSLNRLTKRQFHDLIRPLGAYERYIIKTLNGKNPEEPTKERPTATERITSLTDADNSRKVFEYKRDQEEINIIKSLSPEAKKSLDDIAAFYKEISHTYVPPQSHEKRPTSSSQEEDGPRPQEIVEMPKTDLNVYHNLDGQWTFEGPFNTGF